MSATTLFYGSKTKLLYLRYGEDKSISGVSPINHFSTSLYPHLFDGLDLFVEVPQGELVFYQFPLEFAGFFEGYQTLVVTHTNREHLHNHIIVNSVSFEDGKKLHMEKADLQALKDYSNEVCRKYGLTITDTDTRAGKMQKWKKDLIHTAFLAVAYTDTIDGFIGYMENHGYGVRWEADRKYITFTTPNGIKVRDNKLFDERLLKDNLELYYAMGGCLGPMANEYAFYKTPEHEGNAKQTMSTGLVNLIGNFLSIPPQRALYTPRQLTEMDKWEKERLEEILGKKISTEAFVCYCTKEEYEQQSGLSLKM